MPRVVDAQGLDGLGVQRFRDNCSGWAAVGLSWFETRGDAALLTMRITVRPHPESLTEKGE